MSEQESIAERVNELLDEAIKATEGRWPYESDANFNLRVARYLAEKIAQVEQHNRKTVDKVNRLFGAAQVLAAKADVPMPVEKPDLLPEAYQHLQKLGGLEEYQEHLRNLRVGGE